MKYGILTVIYHETKAHYNMAVKTWDSFPKDVQILSVVNRLWDGAPAAEYLNYTDLKFNNENCLSKAWNIGLKELFKKYEYVVVSGLDSVSPSKPEISEMVDMLKENPGYGIISAIPGGFATPSTKIIHGDGSFSFFVINKRTFEDVGDFNERFKPAYFEDDDYLERLWLKGYSPTKAFISYYHVTQGTVKHGDKVKKEYPEFMQKNLEIYKEIYGKVPDHLPLNIRFK